MRYKSLKALKQTFDANYRVKDQMIFGKYQGFNFYLALEDKNFTHTLVMNASGVFQGLLKEKLQEIASKHENIDATDYKNNKIMMHFLPYVEESKTISSIESAVNELTNFLSENGFTNKSEKDDDTSDDIDLFETNKKEKLFISNEYAKEWNQLIEQEYEYYLNKPYKKWLAIILSIVFALPIIGIWLLLYTERVSFSGLIAGSLMMLLSFFGYYLISKKITNKILVFLSITTFIVIIIGQFFSFNHFVYNLILHSTIPINHYFETFEHFSAVLNINFILADLIYSISGAIIGATIVLTFLLRSVYVRRVNAYGALKVYSDEEEYADDEDEE